MIAALALPAWKQTHDQVVTSFGSRPFGTSAHPGLSVAGSPADGLPVAGMTVAGIMVQVP